MKTSKNIALLGLIIFTVLTLTGCADAVKHAVAETMQPVGFWYGLWHGVILPIAWIISIFDSDVAIYATYNNGGWYDFGFTIGVAVLTRNSIGYKKINARRNLTTISYNNPKYKRSKNYKSPR